LIGDTTVGMVVATAGRDDATGDVTMGVAGFWRVIVLKVGVTVPGNDVELMLVIAAVNAELEARELRPEVRTFGTAGVVCCAPLTTVATRLEPPSLELTRLIPCAELPRAEDGIIILAGVDRDGDVPATPTVGLLTNTDV